MAIRPNYLVLSLMASLFCLPFQSSAQTETLKTTALAASAPTAVPALVPFAGTAIAGDGKPISGEYPITFAIYKDEAGGEPLFAETQSVIIDLLGHYKAELGATLPSGLPADLFSTGEARWLEVQIAGQAEQTRVLLASVPYALKAADATTLGGLPASAFALAVSNTVLANSTSGAVSPDAALMVTTTGGTANKVAKFSGDDTIINSILYDNGIEVGIGTSAPTATLSVNGTLAIDGTSTYNDSLTLEPTGTATASKSYNSPAVKMYASAYNSSTKSAVPPHFEWQAEPTGNDTPSPNATLNLLATSGANGIAETGLYLNTNGNIHFALGQTFPGTGTITSVGLSAPSSDFTVSGSPVTGAGTLGLNWKVAPTNADNANSIVKRDATGSFVAGAITASLGVEGVTSVGNGNGVAGIHNGGGIAVLGESLQTNGVGVYGDGANYGVQGSSDNSIGVGGTGSIGVLGQSTGTNGESDGVHGVTGSAGGSGVAGVNTAGGIGVYGTGGTGVFGTGSSYGFATDSNVNQARSAGGWIKAMVEVQGEDLPYSIPRCFNSTLAGAAATTPPCGIEMVNESTGTFNLTFNFEVDDRFYTTQLLDDSALALVIYRDGPNTLQTISYFSVGNPEGAKYQLIIY